MEGMTGRMLALQGAVSLLGAWFLGLYGAMFVWGRYDQWVNGLDWVALFCIVGTGSLSAAAVLSAKKALPRWIALLGSSAVQVVLGILLLSSFFFPPMQVFTTRPTVPSFVDHLWYWVVGLPGFILLVLGISGLVVVGLDPSFGWRTTLGRQPSR